MGAKDFLIRMSNASGVSGFETERSEIVAETLAPYCDETSVDRFGNAICLKKGKGKSKILIAAHVDEIGLMAADIDERGFVKLTTIGGFDQRTLLAQEVIIHGKEKVFGVIGIKPPHLTPPEDRKKAVKLEDLAVDTGLPADEVKKLVTPGDIITINRQATELLGDRITGKAMDDTAGIASFMYALELLRDFNHDADVYFAATSQEEVRCLGAGLLAYSLKPDIAIAVDVCFGRTSELSETESSEFGGGADIGCGPNIHPGVYERLRETAKKNNIKYQISVCPGMSGTDAITMQIAGEGVATGVVSIPLKYMHTSVELVAMSDIEAAGRLIAEFVKSLNNCDMEEFLCL